jgi:hypothetical protein
VNVEELKAAITAGAVAAEQSTATAAQARDLAGEGGALADATCHDSRHTLVRDGHAHWTKANEQASAMIERLAASAAAAKAYLEAIT